MRKLAALALAVASTGLFAAGNGATATSTGEVKIHVVSPVAVWAKQAMEFGNVLINDENAPAKVIMGTDSQISYDTNCQAMTGRGRSSAAEFELRRDKDFPVSIQTTGTLTGGLAFDPTAFTNDYSGGHHGHHDHESIVKEKFHVGATVNIPAEYRAWGRQTGSISVTVAYL
nr:DUF4402 domain-containing protein [uncultured Holophaga sp.]